MNRILDDREPLIQYGSVNIEMAQNPQGFYGGSISLTFDTPFKNVPIILANATSYNLVVNIINGTSTGCVLQLLTKEEINNVNVPINWVAIGERAD